MRIVNHPGEFRKPRSEAFGANPQLLFRLVIGLEKSGGLCYQTASLFFMAGEILLGALD
jgi:hypothetical protein